MQNIPKKIHYCWFGGNPLSEMAKRCIESWKKYCPDYEIIEWNEQSFDLNYNEYVREAYEQKKWAFLSDVVRLYALVEFGGIYLDTDVEIVKSFDDMLDNRAFIGFQSVTSIQTAVMACEKGNHIFRKLLNDYQGQHFIKGGGNVDYTTNVERITNIFLEYGLLQNNEYQVVEGCVFYPTEFFCPLNVATRCLNTTRNTYAIHHFEGSWLNEEERYENQLKPKISKYISIKWASLLARFISIIKYRGIKQAIREYVNWFSRRRSI